tara:strand:+ start:2096 stop:3040 length:945 start_codon:yes stop_codon:yes gene_type:complete
MALNIPMPGQPGTSFLEGIGAGSDMFSKMMQPEIQRRQMAQQLMEHKDNLGIQQQQQARLQQQFNQSQDDRAMLDQMMNGGGQEQAGGMQTQGNGQVMPDGLNMSAIQNSPMLRGMFKTRFGFDPAAQTPEQKQALDIDTFQKKEDIKAAQELKLPAAVKTLHENIIQLSPKAIEAIDHIMDIPSPFDPWGLGAIKSGQKAAHTKGVTAAAENYVKAKGWPNTKGSIDKAESILARGNFETDYDYRQRLEGYNSELREGIQRSNNFLYPNKQGGDSQTSKDREDERVGEDDHLINKDLSSMSNEELIRIASGGK